MRTNDRITDLYVQIIRLVDEAVASGDYEVKVSRIDDEDLFASITFGGMMTYATIRNRYVSLKSDVIGMRSNKMVCERVLREADKYLKIENLERIKKEYETA